MADVCGELEVQRFNTFFCCCCFTDLFLHVSPFYIILCVLLLLSLLLFPTVFTVLSLDGLDVTLAESYLLLLLHLCSSGLCFLKVPYNFSKVPLPVFTAIYLFKFKLRGHVKYNKIEASSVFLNEMYVITVGFFLSILRLGL